MNTMQQLNSVILRGIIGTVRVSQVADTKVVNMTVATNYAYKNMASEVILETTWHRIVGFEKSLGIDVETLSKGDKVEVQGRLRNQRYIGEDGVERTMSEVLASRIEKFCAEEPLQYEV